MMYRIILQNVLTGEENIWDFSEEAARQIAEAINNIAGPPKKARLTVVETTDKDGQTLRYEY